MACGGYFIKQEIKMKTAMAVQGITFLITATLLLTSLVGTAYAIQLDCLQRDWFTLFAKNSFDVTSMEIATTENFSGLERLAILLTDSDESGEVRSSQLAYVDYSKCETLFFVKNKRTFEAGLFNIAIYTDDINSVKTYETLYQIGKVQDEDNFLVIVIENGNINSFTFDSSDIDFTEYSANTGAKCQLKVLDTGVLLWTHPLGAFLVDLNIRVARSVHFASGQDLLSLVSVAQNDRYIHTLSWQKQSSSDQIWLKTYDFNRLRNVQKLPYLTQDEAFDLGDTVDGVIIAGSSSNSASLCFADSSQRLNLAMWTADAASSFYVATLSSSSNLLFTGCASVEVIDDWDGSHSLKAIVYTSDHRLAYVYQGITASTKSSLTSNSSPVTQSISYTKTSQRITMFEDLSSLQFSITNEFIGINTIKLSESEQWGFVLNTDQTGLRRTVLSPNSRLYETISLSVIDAESQTADEVYALSKIVGNESSTTLLANIAWPFAYNNWVQKLCPQPVNQVLLGKSYDLDYPDSQDLSVYLGPLIETDFDKDSSWYYTCFPVVELDVPAGLVDKFTLVDFDEEATAQIRVEKVASADIFAQREPLFGLGPLYYERVKYQLGLDPSLLASEFNVTAYENQAPRIMNPAPLNNQIFVSIKWQQPSTEVAESKGNSVFQPNPPLLQDIHGMNWDILYESGPVVDAEDDMPRLVMKERSPIFKFELTEERTLRISMAKKMEVGFCGLHNYRFQLADDSDVKGPTNIYDVVIVIGLYDTAEAQKETTEVVPEVEETQVTEDLGKFALVPQKYPIDTKNDWCWRRGYDNRQAQLVIHPISSTGQIRIGFTKAVEMPEQTLDLILSEKLVNVTFVPSSYDFEEDGGKTGLKDWSITHLSAHGFTVKVVFDDPNMIGYSIYEADQIKLAVNLTSISTDGSTEMLFGRYVKSVPLQYPEQLGLIDIFNIEMVSEIVPYAMALILVISAALLVLSDTIDKTALVWLILSNFQLMAFLPLVHVPIPAQVNEISKGLAKYFRVDFIQLSEGRSLTDAISYYIFDFQASEFEVPLHLEQLGFTSENSFTTASGVNLLHCCFVFPCFLVSLLLWLGRFRYASLNVPFTKIRSVFYNNFYVRYNMETLLIYAVCYLLSLQEASVYNWATSLQTIVSGVHTLLLACLPMTIIFFYNWNYENLVTNKEFRKKWGTLYLGLFDNNEENKRKLIFQYPALLLARKFLFAFSVVILEKYWLVQVVFLLISSAVIITIVYQSRPYTSQILNNLQILHEVTIVILCDLLITFNGGGWLGSDQNMRFLIGWAYAGVLALSLAISFFVLAMVTLSVLRQTLVRRKPNKKRDTTRMARRLSRIQSKRRATVRAQTGIVLAKMMSSPNADLDESSVGDMSLNSPTGNSVVMQQIEAAVTKFKADAERIKRGLTQIEEGESEEEDSGSSVSESESSDFQSCSSHHQQTARAKDFVMGFNLIPKITRQGNLQDIFADEKKGHFITEDNSFSKTAISNSLIGTSFGVSEQGRPLIPQVSSQKNQMLSLTDQKQRNWKITESSEDGPMESVSTQRQQKRGNQTTKHGSGSGGLAGSSFSNAVLHNNLGMPAKTKSVTPKKGASAQCSERDGHHFSGQVSGQVSARSRSHAFYGAVSRRSNVSRIDSIDEEVNQRLEALAQLRVSRRETKSHDLIGSAVRRPYVMGQHMAQKSMVHDMSESIMLLSKVHEEKKSQDLSNIINQGQLLGRPQSGGQVRLFQNSGRNGRLKSTQSEHFQVIFDSQEKILELNHHNIKQRLSGKSIRAIGDSNSKELKSIPSYQELLPPLHNDSNDNTPKHKKLNSRKSSKNSRKSSQISRSKQQLNVKPLSSVDDDFFKNDNVSPIKPVEDTYIDLNRNIPLDKSNQKVTKKPSRLVIDVKLDAKHQQRLNSPTFNDQGVQQPPQKQAEVQEQERVERKQTRGRSPRQQELQQHLFYEKKMSRKESKKSRAESPTFQRQVSRANTRGKSPRQRDSNAALEGLNNTSNYLEQPGTASFQRKVSHHYEEYERKNSWFKHVSSVQDTSKIKKSSNNSSSLQDIEDSSLGAVNKQKSFSPKDKKLSLNLHLQKIADMQNNELSNSHKSVTSNNSCKSLKALVQRENLKYELNLEKKVINNSARRAKTKKGKQLDQGSGSGSQHQKQKQNQMQENPDFSSDRRNGNAVDIEFKMELKGQNDNFKSMKTPGFGELSSPEPSLAKRQSSVLSKSRPTDMPYLDLSSQNLLAGIHQKVAQKMSKQGSLVRKESIISEMSKFSAFSLDIDERDIMSDSSPSNVHFTSMQ